MPLLKAFLLAAGRGERLRPLTDITPKCLLPINGTPLLQIWLDHLAHSGIDEVLINTHWLHEKVHEFVEKWSAGQRSMKIFLSYEQELLGSAGTIQTHRQWAGMEPFFIIYADNLTNFDLQKMLSFHRKNRQPLTIRIYKEADPKRAGIVCLDKNDIVIDFEEKPLKPKSDLGAGGIYIADHRIFAYYPRQTGAGSSGALDLSYHVLPKMTGKMKAYASDEFSMDIGTPDSYDKARKIWHEKRHNEG